MQLVETTARSPSHKPVGWFKGFLHQARVRLGTNRGRHNLERIDA